MDNINCGKCGLQKKETDAARQRELLIAFQKYFYRGISDVEEEDIEFIVDKYLNYVNTRKAKTIK